MSTIQKFDEVVQDTRAEFPQFKLVPKRHNKFMERLDTLLRIVSFGGMDSFMTRVTTTIGFTVYTPEIWDALPEFDRAAILRHERVHMRQSRRMGSLRFKLYYLFWFFPIGFAWGRMKLEMEAYEESIRTRVEYAGKESLNDAYRESMIKHFTGASYVWTWPWRKRIERWYDGFVSGLD